MLYKMSFFPESYSHSKNKKKVELDFPNYITKSSSKEKTGIDTSKFVKLCDSAKSWVIDMILIHKILIIWKLLLLI